MPAKVRVYEIARELGLSNKQVIDLCGDLGIGVKSHSSQIVEAQADRVRRKADREGLIREPEGDPPSTAPPTATAKRAGKPIPPPPSARTGKPIPPPPSARTGKPIPVPPPAIKLSQPPPAPDTVADDMADRYVFISYSRNDQEYVDRLVDYLSGHGVPTWIDRNTDFGARWIREIRDRVDGCVALVVVMTPTAEDSIWVEREVDRAEKGEKPIYPLLLEGKPFFVLSTSQYVDVSNQSLPPAQFGQLLARQVRSGAPGVT